MKIAELETIREALEFSEVIDEMREALIAQSRGECDTPMPMHLNIPPEDAEVHVKSSYRRGGEFFALKIASTFPGNLARGRSVGNGMMLLVSAETGDPLIYFADQGYMTDIRTAAVSAMLARELRRKDTAIGILGTGLQARYQVQLHAEVLDLKTVWVWGRTPERVETYVADMRTLVPGVEVNVAASPTEVAGNVHLVVTATASRAPLLSAADVRPGTHISAVGADGPGKQELEPEILRAAGLLLVDSLAQCERLGELQHAPDEKHRAVEIGAYCTSATPVTPDDITVADFTGLGVEDLFIAQYCYERIRQ